MKKNLIVFFLIFVILFLIQSINAQEKRKEIRKRPLELPNMEYKDLSRPPVDIGKYSPLPYLYSNINVSADTFPQNEPSVKFNAKYPNRVVAAWRDFRTGVSPPVRRIGYSYSTNSGVSWSASSLIPLVTNYPTVSDPVVVSDTAGNFYIATISITSSYALDIIVYKSTDGGVTFPIVCYAQTGAYPHLEDKEWMVCDLTKGSSPYKNTLYISWTRFFNGNTPHIMVKKSTNGGTNWTAPVQLTSTTVDRQGSCPTIGPNGELYVVWIDFTTTDYIIKFSKSTNGGTNFTVPINITQGLGPNLTISSSNLSCPSIVCDVSGGPRNGWIYATFCDSRNGDPDVFISRSSNGGINWSAPLRVNNDAIGNGKIQCWPWIAINDSGKIVILYYDTRNGTNNLIHEAWFARSSDGGQTFINEKISSIPFSAGEPNPDVRFGDYINVDYKGNRVVPVWTDMRAGAYNQEIYSANINLSVGINQISSNIPEKSELFQNYPNPFNPSTTIKFQLKESGFTTLKVYDMLGKEVSTLVNKNLQAGVYEAHFLNKQVSSGLYFYRLTFNDNMISTKIMSLLK